MSVTLMSHITHYIIGYRVAKKRLTVAVTFADEKWKPSHSMQSCRSCHKRSDKIVDQTELLLGSLGQAENTGLVESQSLDGRMFKWVLSRGRPSWTDAGALRDGVLGLLTLWCVHQVTWWYAKSLWGCYTSVLGVLPFIRPPWGMQHLWFCCVW